MKKYIFVLALFLGFISCETASKATEEPSMVSLFLADVTALVADTNANPIVSFAELAAKESDLSMNLKKENIAKALEGVMTLVREVRSASSDALLPGQSPRAHS